MAGKLLSASPSAMVDGVWVTKPGSRTGTLVNQLTASKANGIFYVSFTVTVVKSGCTLVQIQNPFIHVGVRYR